MSGQYYYFNPGAVLRQLFPKQLKKPSLIIMWAVIFIINIIVVVLVQNYAIYNISEFSKDALQNNKYFNEKEILSVEKKPGKYSQSGDYYVTYKNETGETRIVCLDMFPVSIFERAHLNRSSDVNVTENITSKENILDAIWSKNPLEKLAGIYVAIGTGMLLIEFFLYDVFVKLFRE